MDLPMPDGPNKDLWLALVHRDHVKLEASLRAGADPNAKDHWGTAPAMLATFCDDARAVSLLLQYGAHFPASAKGGAYDAYFDVSPPRYDFSEGYEATVVAIKNKNLDLLRTLLSMPGAAERYGPDSWVYVAKAEFIASKGDRRFLQALVEPRVLKALDLQGADSNLARVACEAAASWVVSLVGNASTLHEFTVISAKDHLEDRNATAGAGGIVALAFSVTHAEDRLGILPFPIRRWQEKEFAVEGPRESATDRYRIGQWRPSPFAAVRGSVRLGQRSGEYDDDDAHSYEEHCREVAGTAYFSEDPALLGDYMRSLGPVDATVALVSAAHVKDDAAAYSQAVEAIVAGADTSLSFFGWVAADLMTAASGRTAVLRALIEHDPVTQRRLGRSSSRVVLPFEDAAGGKGFLRFPLAQTAFGVHLPGNGYSAIEDAALLLLEAGAKPDVTVGENNYALWSAVSTAKPRLTRKLLEAGFDPNYAVEEEGPALRLALWEHDIARILIDGGADPCLPVLLHNACRVFDRATVEILLTAGADPAPALSAIAEGSLDCGDAIESILRAAQARHAIRDTARRSVGRLISSNHN